PAKPQPGAVRPTPAERFVQAMDRAEKSFAYPDVTWAALKPEAAALGITMPFSMQAWQQIMTAALEASPATQSFLFLSADRFGDSYEEAAYRTFNVGARTLFVRMQCAGWAIRKHHEEPWAAESILLVAKQLLESDPLPATPEN